MQNLSKEEKLLKSNSMGAKLINARYQHVSLIQKNIDNWKNIKIMPIEDTDFKLINLKKYIISNKLNLVNRKIAYWFELIFGILTFNSYVDIDKKSIISSDVKINECKLFCINTLSFSYSFKKLHYLGFWSI